MTADRRHRFLLLEDNPLDAELEQQRLREAGFEFDLTLVENRAGFEAEFENNPYDLILADYSLPDFDGLSALAIVRAKYGKLPFIFVSGAMGEDVAIDTMLRGATDYVVKSRLDRLQPAVRRALAEHEEYLRREKAETELRAAEAKVLATAEQQAVLLGILRQQRKSTTAEKLMLTACNRLTAFMHVSSAGFYEVSRDGTLKFLWQWGADNARSEELLRRGHVDEIRESATGEERPSSSLMF